MPKHSISSRETQVGLGNAVAKQVEQTVSVDDLSLPSAQELKAYQEIDPNIVTFLIETSQKEQAHRQKMDEKKIKLLSYVEHKNGRMSWWGLFFAFLSLVALVSLAAYALYLNHNWFAVFFGFGAVISIVTVFVNAGKNNDLNQ